MNANTHSMHACKQPNRSLVLLHLMGTNFKDFTCQWNQADKQKRDLSLAAQCYSSIPLLLHFNLLELYFHCFSGCAHAHKHTTEASWNAPVSSSEAPGKHKHVSFRTCTGTHEPTTMQRMLWRKKKLRMHAESWKDVRIYDKKWEE